MDERSAVFERLEHVRHGRQRVVVDLDERGGVSRLGTGLGDDDRDAVADVARLVDSERQVRGHDDVVRHGPEAGECSVAVFEVLAGERGDDAWRRTRFRDVHLRDPCVGKGAADDGGMEQTRGLVVVDVACRGR